MGMDWQKLLTSKRLGSADTSELLKARSPFQRDFDRIAFSDAFRRLSDKTQVFPLPEDDHVHTRLTHSLETSIVGRSIGTLVGQELLTRDSLGEIQPRDVGDIVAAACLAHDIGNPPFGHSGEAAVSSWFAKRLADYESTAHCAERDRISRANPWLDRLIDDPTLRASFEKFEGNAQGFRIAVRHQCPDEGGLKLTYAVLGAFTKYPRSADPGTRDKSIASFKKHGFFASEEETFKKIADALGFIPKGSTCWARHPLAYAVEAADDICYRILDLEDGFRLKLVSFDEVETPLLECAKANEDFKPDRYADQRSNDKREYVSTLRAHAIHALTVAVAEKFLAIEDSLLKGEPKAPLVEQIELWPRLEAIQKLSKEHCYGHQDVVQIEMAGYTVIGELLDRFTTAVFDPQTDRAKKMKQVVPQIFLDDPDPVTRLQAITDYIVGMTDSYAVTLYRRLVGVQLPHGR